jgi:hypothetical protein
MIRQEIIRQFKFEVQQRLIYPRRILQRVFCSQVTQYGDKS